MNHSLALSSWTTHGMLGKLRYVHDFQNAPILEEGEPEGALTLIELPKLAASAGIFKLELCHFHFPTTDPGYLIQLKAAVEAAETEIENILIDTGNLSNLNSVEWEASLKEAKAWQQVAAEVGALGCRIDCGTEPPSPESKAQAAQALRQLIDHGTALGIETTTENFRATSVYPGDLFEIMDACERPLNLCVDFGNAKKTGDKFGTLKRLLPRGTSIHVKGEYVGGVLDQTELAQGLALIQASAFSGFMTLIVDGTENEWERTLELRDAILKA